VNQLPISRQDKEEQIRDLAEKLKQSQAVFVTSYQGMTMSQFNGLRGKLRESKATYQVVKNTLAARAFKDAGLAVPAALLDGPVALGFAYEDIGSSAKTLLAYGRENEKFQLKGAVLGQSILDLKEVERLSDLPTLPVVRATLLGMLRAPASRVVGAVAGGVRQVMNVVKAYADKEAAPAAA
jgi:large subunit ribosomal protein L10